MGRKIDMAEDAKDQPLTIQPPKASSMYDINSIGRTNWQALELNVVGSDLIAWSHLLLVFVIMTATPLPSAFDQLYPRIESNLSNIIKDMNALYKELTEIQSDMIAGNKRERLGQGNKLFRRENQDACHL